MHVDAIMHQLNNLRKKNLIQHFLKNQNRHSFLLDQNIADSNDKIALNKNHLKHFYSTLLSTSNKKKSMRDLLSPSSPVSGIFSSVVVIAVALSIFVLVPDLLRHVQLVHVCAEDDRQIDADVGENLRSYLKGLPQFQRRCALRKL